MPQMYEEAIKFLHLHLTGDRDVLNVLYGWAIVRSVGKTDKETGYEKTSRALMDELLLGQTMEDTLRNLGFDEQHLSQLVTAVAFLTTHQHWNSDATGRSIHSFVELLLNDSDIKKFIRVNRHRGVLWFSKEGFDDLLFYLLVIAVTDLFSDGQKTEEERTAEIARAYGILKPLLSAAEQSGYQVEKLLDIAKSL